MASPIFVSACLLGFPVRWDGKTVSGDYASILTKFVSRGGRIVSLCPECPGGLPTPHPVKSRQGTARTFCPEGLA